MKISLVQESLEALKPYFSDAFEHFTIQLERQNPQTLKLIEAYASNGLQQAKTQRSIANFLTHIVEFWNEKDHLHDYLAKAGRKYSTLVENPEITLSVERALTETLEFCFESQWTAELRECWTKLYNFVITEMRNTETSSLRPPVVPFSLEASTTQIAHELVKSTIHRVIASPEIRALIEARVHELLKQSIEAQALQTLQSIAQKQAAA